MQNIDEAKLIAHSINGDNEAYAEVVNRYKNAVYYHCFAIVRDEDVAQDIAQDTFISAFYNLNRYDNKYRLSTWLFKISTNKCLNYLKKKGKEVAADDKLITAIASREPSPHNQALYSELHNAVQVLQPKYQAVISLHYWQGLDYAATAEVMGAPINSVRVWLKRAKEELRKELI
ncbi:MAG: polymerase, sigma-24 subunit, subfamily [Candidatus Saccharibacteria bacterium]|nr:polymerase, sigma-24 subunit, subfamily [Candidatus Saccharibacteria bacterium]